MKAIVFTEKGKADIWNDLEPPKIEEPNEILISSVFTGISTGTERWQLTAGPYSPGFPMIPGYQCVGKIEQVGAGVKELAVGDYVMSDYSRPPANYITKGLKYLDWIWGHQEIHVTNLKRAIKLPPDEDPEQYALLPVASIGFHACCRGRITPGERVLVFGLGIIGQFCAQSARAMGAKVFGCDLDEWRLKMAKQYSCDEVLGPKKEALIEDIKRYSPFDVAIETTAGEGVVNSCLDAIRHHGRVVLVAGRFTMTYDNLKAQVHEAQIVHTNHFERQDALEVMRRCGAGKMQIKPLITHRLKLRNAPDFYRWILGSQEKLLGAVIGWRSE